MTNRHECEPKTILSLRTVIYHAVHKIRGGVAAVAGACGYNANTLQNKINLNNEGRHVLSVPEFEAILQFTRDPRLMDSLCAIYGNAIWIDVSGMNDVTDSNMIMSLGDVSTNVGTLACNVAKALEDGIVTTDEVATLKKSVMTLIQSAQAVLALAEQMQERGE